MTRRHDELETSWHEKRRISRKLKKDCDVFLESGGTVEVLETKVYTAEDLKEGFAKTQLKYRRIFSERIQ